MHVHICVHDGACVACVLYVPVQLKPLPSKPSLHVQLKLPSVSVQLALELHVCISSSHSLISVQSDRLISVHGHKEDSDHTTMLGLFTGYIFLKQLPHITYLYS